MSQLSRQIDADLHWGPEQKNIDNKNMTTLQMIVRKLIPNINKSYIEEYVTSVY